MSSRRVKTYRIHPDEEALARAAARREGIPLATAAREALVRWAARKVTEEQPKSDRPDRG